MFIVFQHITLKVPLLIIVKPSSL